MKESITTTVIENISKTLRTDERKAVVNKLPRNSRLRFLAEIAHRGLADKKGKDSADELVVQERVRRGGVRTTIFDRKEKIYG